MLHFQCWFRISISHSPYLFMQICICIQTQISFHQWNRQISKRNLDVDSTDDASIKLNWHKRQSEWPYAVTHPDKFSPDIQILELKLGQTQSQTAVCEHVQNTLHLALTSILALPTTDRHNNHTGRKTSPFPSCLRRALFELPSTCQHQSLCLPACPWIWEMFRVLALEFSSKHRISSQRSPWVQSAAVILHALTLPLHSSPHLLFLLEQSCWRPCYLLCTWASPGKATCTDMAIQTIPISCSPMVPSVQGQPSLPSKSSWRNSSSESACFPNSTHLSPLSYSPVDISSLFCTVSW